MLLAGIQWFKACGCPNKALGHDDHFGKLFNRHCSESFMKWLCLLVSWWFSKLPVSRKTSKIYAAFEGVRNYSGFSGKLKTAALRCGSSSIKADNRSEQRKQRKKISVFSVRSCSKKLEFFSNFYRFMALMGAVFNLLNFNPADVRPPAVLRIGVAETQNQFAFGPQHGIA